MYRALAIVLLLLCTACSQSIDFDVRVHETFDWAEIIDGQLPPEATTVEVPGGLELAFSLGQHIDLIELDGSLGSVLEGGSLHILAARYQVPENTSSHAVPSFRLSIADGTTDQLQESRMVARLPAIPAGDTDVDVPVPWAPDGRQSLEAAMAINEFSYFVSGVAFLEEGSPVPTGTVSIDLIVTARNQIAQ